MPLSGGSFTASSGTTSIGGALKISGSAAFNANGGTVSFGGTGGASLRCDEATFNLVTFANTKGTKTVGPDCSLPLGANPKAEEGGSITVNGTLSGTGTLTTAGTLTLGTTGELSGFSGLAARNLTVRGSYDFGEYEPFTVGGAFSLTASGSFTAPSENTASFGKSSTLSPESTFEANEGTVSFDGIGRVHAGVWRQDVRSGHLRRIHRSQDHRHRLHAAAGVQPGPRHRGDVLNGTLSGAGHLDPDGGVRNR